MAELLLVLFIALMVIGWGLIWLHDNSSKCFWHNNVWSVVGVITAVVGVFGTIFSLGAIFGTNIMEVFA